MRLVIAGLLLIMTLPASAQDVFQVHGRTNCGGSGNGVVRVLAAGTHDLTISGGISFWSSDSFNGGNTWISRLVIKDLSTGVEEVFDAGVGFLPSRAAAEAAISGMVFTFDLPADATVAFYHTDGGGCGDNRSYVTVSLDDPIVGNDRSSWGEIKSAYR